LRFGVLTFAADGAMEAVAIGRVVEDLGFESLWLSEHSHIPTSRLSPFGGRPGAPPLPAHYRKGYDAMVALAAIASTTTGLRLGTGVCLVAQHDPFWLAKQVASLDALSGGRFLFGVGYGWNKEEMLHHGVEYSQRRAILREKVLAMKALWTQEEASFEGEHVRFERSWAWPKPVQEPHPPIVVGAGPGPKTYADIVELADGWMPNYGRYELERGITELHAAALTAGRDPATIELAITNAPKEPAELERLAGLGISRALFSVKPADEPVMTRALEVCADVVVGYRRVVG
jgi:probable F420-dependent oxidoreductase